MKVIHINKEQAITLASSAMRNCAGETDSKNVEIIKHFINEICNEFGLTYRAETNQFIRPV